MAASQDPRNAHTPGAKLDGGKLRYDHIPPEVLEALAQVLTHGAVKYSPGGWRTVEQAKDRYYAALERHLQAWRLGEAKAEDSGLHHLKHALANAAFLVALEGLD